MFLLFIYEYCYFTLVLFFCQVFTQLLGQHTKSWVKTQALYGLSRQERKKTFF